MKVAIGLFKVNSIRGCQKDCQLSTDEWDSHFVEIAKRFLVLSTSCKNCTTAPHLRIAICKRFYALLLPHDELQANLVEYTDGAVDKRLFTKKKPPVHGSLM